MIAHVGWIPSNVNALAGSVSGDRAGERFMFWPVVRYTDGPITSI